jgi:hypothetical protein
MWWSVVTALGFSTVISKEITEVKGLCIQVCALRKPKNILPSRKEDLLLTALADLPAQVKASTSQVSEPS